jgi:hypothetical protein
LGWGRVEEDIAVYELVPRHQLLERYDIFERCFASLNRRMNEIVYCRTARNRRQICRLQLASQWISSHAEYRHGVVDTFLLTVGAAHKLFGYDLDLIRHYDLRWNGDRTHIEGFFVCRM